MAKILSDISHTEKMGMGKSKGRSIIDSLSANRPLSISLAVFAVAAAIALYFILTTEIAQGLKMAFVFILGIIFSVSAGILAYLYIVARRRRAKERKEAMIFKAGSEGEKIIAEQLEQLPDSYYVWNDVSISPFDRVAHIDHVVIGPTGVFILETKSYAGKVTCDEKGNWRRSKKGRRGEVIDPSRSISQLNSYSYTLKRLFLKHNLKLWIDRYIVSSTSKWEIKDKKIAESVIHVDELLDVIRKKKERLSPKITHRIAQVIENEKILEGRGDKKHELAPPPESSSGGKPPGGTSRSQQAPRRPQQKGGQPRGSGRSSESRPKKQSGRPQDKGRRQPQQRRQEKQAQARSQKPQEKRQEEPPKPPSESFVYTGRSRSPRRSSGRDSSRKGSSSSRHSGSGGSSQSRSSRSGSSHRKSSEKGSSRSSQGKSGRRGGRKERTAPSKAKGKNEKEKKS